MSSVAPPHEQQALFSAAEYTRLSGRELQTLQLVANGRSNAEIGTLMEISSETVKSHLRSIFTKTGADNRAAAVAFGFRTGIIS
jgi:DNA-binding CsgD family transcriptional regulator